MSAALGTVKDSQWTTTIGQLCDEFGGEVQTGPFGSQLHASDYSQDGTPVVMPQDMHDGTVVCDKIARVGNEHVQMLKRHALRSGDIVYSRRGDVTRFAVITEREAGWLCGTGSIRIRLNCPGIDIRYLRHYLQQDIVGDWLKHNAKGVTMLNLNTAIIRGLPFVYPPLPEQRRIAAILDKAAALRAKRREAIAKLDQLLQSVFLEMFGGSTAATTSVAELAPSAGAIRTGPFGSQLLHSEFVDHGIAVLGIDNAVSNTFTWAKPRFITAEKYAQLSRYRVNPGDVLITIMGTCGRCAVVPDDIPTAINTKHLCCITLDPSRCEPEFLHSYFLMHPVARSYLESRAKGAIMAGLNMAIIKELPVALPSIEEQRRFVAIKRSLGRQRAEAVSQERRSDEFFAAVQQHAFAGTL